VAVAELAAAAGVSTAHLQEVERGVASARIETIFAIAGGLGLPAAELVARAEAQLARGGT
jgi:transcriptional regulator with XRE-family HTH domain